MKKISAIHFTLIFSAIILFSCNSPSHGDTDNSLPKFNIVDTEQPFGQEADFSSTDLDVQQVSSNVTLNPPHGEPGHDCAIPVGQPLNKPAGVTPAPQTPTTSPASMMPGTRLNPPHGQPGHRCEIPVGQPLP